nr:peptidase [Aureimonas sp. AU22]
MRSVFDGRVHVSLDMAPPDTLPTAALFAAPAFSQAQISRDGQFVAYLAPWRGWLNVFLATIRRSSDRLDARMRLTAGDLLAGLRYQFGPVRCTSTVFDPERS